MTGGNFEGIGSVLNQKLRVFILYIYIKGGGLIKFRVKDVTIKCIWMNYYV